MPKLTGKVVGIIIVIALTIGVFLWVFLKQSPSPSESESPVPAAPSTVYVNEKHGFQIQFPENWHGYRVSEGVYQEADTVAFLLPTYDPTWTQGDPAHPGYATILELHILGREQWGERCAADRAACETRLAGETASQAVSWFIPTELPADFASYNIGETNYLKANFKTTP